MWVLRGPCCKHFYSSSVVHTGQRSTHSSFTFLPGRRNFFSSLYRVCHVPVMGHCHAGLSLSSPFPSKFLDGQQIYFFPLTSHLRTSTCLYSPILKLLDYVRLLYLNDCIRGYAVNCKPTFPMVLNLWIGYTCLDMEHLHGDGRLRPWASSSSPDALCVPSTKQKLLSTAVCWGQGHPMLTNLSKYGSGFKGKLHREKGSPTPCCHCLWLWLHIIKVNHITFSA